MITIWHNPRCSKSRQALALLDAVDDRSHRERTRLGTVVHRKGNRLIEVGEFAAQHCLFHLKNKGQPPRCPIRCLANIRSLTE